MRAWKPGLRSQDERQYFYKHVLNTTTRRCFLHLRCRRSPEYTDPLRGSFQWTAGVPTPPSPVVCANSGLDQAPPERTACPTPPPATATRSRRACAARGHGSMALRTTGRCRCRPVPSVLFCVNAFPSESGSGWLLFSFNTRVTFLGEVAQGSLISQEKAAGSRRTPVRVSSLAGLGMLT